MDIKRTCQHCGTKIRGRSDKKFCSDACRNAFNNRQHETVNTVIRSINLELKKNRRILESFLDQGREQVRMQKQLLLEVGFHFGLQTHVFTGPGGILAHYCYDYGYRLEGEDVVIFNRPAVEFSGLVIAEQTGRAYN